MFLWSSHISISQASRPHSKYKGLFLETFGHTGLYLANKSDKAWFLLFALVHQIDFVWTKSLDLEKNFYLQIVL